MSKLSAEITKVSSLFQDSTSRFIIPHYQRDYAWDEKQVLELIFDIETGVNSSPSNMASASVFYLGNILLRVQSNGRSTHFFVIDGQQRLTTLSILFCIMYNFAKQRESTFKTALTEANEDPSIIDTILNKIKEYVLKMDIDTSSPEEFGVPNNYVFVPKKTDALFYKHCIVHRYLYNTRPSEDVVEVINSVSNSRKGHHRMVGNAEILNKWLKQSYTQFSKFKKLYDFISKSMHLGVIKVEDGSLEFKIFNSINSRGLKISPLDSLKAHYFDFQETQDKPTIPDLWDFLSTQIAEEELELFFMLIKNIYCKDFSTQTLSDHNNQLYFNLNQSCDCIFSAMNRVSNAENQVKDFLKLLGEYSKFYRYLLYPTLLLAEKTDDNHFEICSIIRSIKFLSLHHDTRYKYCLLQLFYNYFPKVGRYPTSYVKFAQLLSEFEISCFVFYYSTRVIVDNQFFIQKLQQINNYSEILQKGGLYDSETLTSFQTIISGRDFDPQKQEQKDAAKYVLKFTEYCKWMRKSDKMFSKQEFINHMNLLSTAMCNVQLEHIVPQSLLQCPDWSKYWSDSLHANHVNSIENLALVHQSEQQPGVNQSWEMKKARYSECKFLSTQELSKLQFFYCTVAESRRKEILEDVGFWAGVSVYEQCSLNIKHFSSSNSSATIKVILSGYPSELMVSLSENLSPLHEVVGNEDDKFKMLKVEMKSTALFDKFKEKKIKSKQQKSGGSVLLAVFKNVHPYKVHFIVKGYAWNATDDANVADFVYIGKAATTKDGKGKVGDKTVLVPFFKEAMKTDSQFKFCYRPSLVTPKISTKIRHLCDDETLKIPVEQENKKPAAVFQSSQTNQVPQQDVIMQNLQDSQPVLPPPVFSQLMQQDTQFTNSSQQVLNAQPSQYSQQSQHTQEYYRREYPPAHPQRYRERGHSFRNKNRGPYHSEVPRCNNERNYFGKRYDRPQSRYPLNKWS